VRSRRREIRKYICFKDSHLAMMAERYLHTWKDTQDHLNELKDKDREPPRVLSSKRSLKLQCESTIDKERPRIG